MRARFGETRREVNRRSRHVRRNAILWRHNPAPEPFMLIISNDDVAKLLTMADCIRVQEEAFKKLPTGGAMHRPRIDMYMPCDLPDGYFRWGSMEGANDGYF